MRRPAIALLGEELRSAGVDQVAEVPRERVRPRPAPAAILDNGLVFGAKVFVNVVRRYGLDQEYITRTRRSRTG